MIKSLSQLNRKAMLPEICDNQNSMRLSAINREGSLGELKTRVVAALLAGGLVFSIPSSAISSQQSGQSMDSLTVSEKAMYIIGGLLGVNSDNRLQVSQSESSVLQVRYKDRDGKNVECSIELRGGNEPKAFLNSRSSAPALIREVCDRDAVYPNIKTITVSKFDSNTSESTHCNVIHGDIYDSNKETVCQTTTRKKHPASSTNQRWIREW